MEFSEFVFICGVAICVGLCATFGALLGIGLFAALKGVVK